MTEAQCRVWAEGLLEGHDFPSQEVQAIQEVLERCERRVYRVDGKVCTEGHAGDELFFLVQGSVQVRKAFPGDDERELAVLRAPAMFGHMSVVDGSKRSATCVARDTTTVMVLDAENYKRLMSEVGPTGTNFRRLMLTSLTRQLLRGNAKLRALLGGPDVHAPGDPVSIADPDTEDLDNDDLLEMAGLLEGWKVDTRGLSSMKQVEDEDMKRIRTDSRERGS